jgi:hypothetical protein
MSINSHFVSRFLTQPWEHGQRMLWYYDFDDNRIRSQSSRSLFAAIGANSADVEAPLNRIVESPIAAARARLQAPGADVPPTLDWPLFRALALLLLLQPFRASESAEGPQTLEEMLARPEPEIDGIAHAIGTRYRLMRVTVSPAAPLFYPSDGWFPLLAEPMGRGCPFGIAIPLSERHVFIGIPAAVDAEQTEIWSMNGAGLVSNYSVGHRSRRVVVHPTAVSRLPEADIVQAIRGSREGVERAIELCQELSAVVRRMDAVFSG